MLQVKTSHQILCDLHSTVCNAFEVKKKVLEFLGNNQNRMEVFRSINRIKLLLAKAVSGDKSFSLYHIAVLQRAHRFLDDLLSSYDVFIANSHLALHIDGIAGHKLEESEIAEIQQIVFKVEFVYLNKPAEFILQDIENIILLAHEDNNPSEDILEYLQSFFFLIEDFETEKQIKLNNEEPIFDFDEEEIIPGITEIGTTQAAA